MKKLREARLACRLLFVCSLGQIMRVAITVFGSTISPVFDAAQRLLVIDLGDGAVQVRCEEEIGGLDLAQRVSRLIRLGVRVLACGAIGEFSRYALQERGIEVYPWVSGQVQDVLDILALRWSVQPDRADAPRKLAIPTTGSSFDALVAPTFRRCSHLLVVKMPGRRRTVTRAPDGLAGAEGCHLLARLIVEAGARVLLTGRCGANELGILAVAGVDVIQGVEGTARDVVNAYSEGALRPQPRRIPMSGSTGRG